jgi:hypothetical protein
MLASFWSGLGGELAKQWVPRILTPAFAFWTAGLAAVWWDSHGDAVQTTGWTRELERTTGPFEHLPVLGQAVVVVAALMLVAVSGLIAERLTLPLLRLLEGYWPWWLRRRTVSRRRERRETLSKRRDELSVRQRRGGLSPGEYVELLRLQAAPQEDPRRLQELRRRRVTGGLTPRDAAELAHTRAVLYHSPADDGLAMPTRFGDVLRAAERRPIDKYGLDSVVCWPALWLVMPADARTEIAQARGRVDAGLRMWLWGALFIVWTPWTLWAIPIALFVPLLAYYGSMLGAAKLFGALVGTTFDLYRMQLYDALRLPRPASPADEPRRGVQVTNLLRGGLDDASVRYVD